jgi:hypothetical protein
MKNFSIDYFWEKLEKELRKVDDVDDMEVYVETVKIGFWTGAGAFNQIIRNILNEDSPETAKDRLESLGREIVKATNGWDFDPENN